MKKLSLMEVLEGIDDTRRERSEMHELHEVLIIMFLAVICGATSYAKVEMFGKSKIDWLRTFLKLEHGISDGGIHAHTTKTYDRWLKNRHREWEIYRNASKGG